MAAPAAGAGPPSGGDTVPNLAWYGVLSALVSLVLIRIVVVTSQSYGLSRFALEMVVRVLVLELIPLCAAAFVALRTTLPAGLELAQRRHAAAPPTAASCIANSSRAWRPASSRCGCWRRSAAC
jgi:hypothetical protein